MTTSDRTSTLPRAKRAPNANDPITALRDLTNAWTGRVSIDRVTSSLGRAATCDVVLERPFVSAVHCYLERRPAGLRVTNNSKNGTWFAGAPLPTFELRAGEAFQIGDAQLFAMTALMEDADAELRRLLGSDDRARVTRALRLGASAASVALLGEPGSGHAEAATVLHGISPRRPRRLEAITSVDDLAHLIGRDGDGTRLLDLGGVFLDLARVPRLAKQAPELARALEEVVRGGAIGVYIACEHVGEVAAQLGFAIGSEQQLDIPPLRQRADDVPALIEHLLGSDALARLGDHNHKALLKHRWRGNLVELRDACDKLRVVVEHGGNLRAAARASGRDHTTLARALHKLGLSFE